MYVKYKYYAYWLSKTLATGLHSIPSFHSSDRSLQFNFYKVTETKTMSSVFNKWWYLIFKITQTHTPVCTLHNIVSAWPWPPRGTANTVESKIQIFEMNSTDDETMLNAQISQPENLTPPFRMNEQTDNWRSYLSICFTHDVSISLLVPSHSLKYMLFINVISNVAEFRW